MSVTQQFERFKTHFCEVLRILCQETGSINQICRDVGINRQQFAKYMSGTNMPSLFFVQKLADYFKISPSVFFLNVEKESIKEYLLDAKNSTTEIVGYYLEYTTLETTAGVQVSVAAWRLYKRGAMVVAHGEVPYIEPSTGQKWFARFSGTVSESHRQLTMSASNAGDRDASISSALWVLRPYRHGMSDLMAVKVQADHSPSRPINTTTPYFRAIGAEPNLAKLVLEECGIFEMEQLNPRAAAIVNILDHSRSITATRLQLLEA